MITEFKGENFPLSNFYICHIVHDGIEYSSVEVAFQAAKLKNKNTRKTIFQSLNPSEAKKLGRKVELRPDWEEVKLQVMEDCVRYKFTANEDLKKFLLSTGDQQLIEGNNWNDTFWGLCNGKGENNLGIILMKIREELKNGT